MLTPASGLKNSLFLVKATTLIPTSIKSIMTDLSIPAFEPECYLMIEKEWTTNSKHLDISLVE